MHIIDPELFLTNYLKLDVKMKDNILKNKGIEIKAKVWFEKNGKPVFGKGKYEILKAIEKNGSISAASKDLKMSYRKIRSIISDAEENLGERLIERKRGGVSGGYTLLTETARVLSEIYENVLYELSGKIFKNI